MSEEITEEAQQLAEHPWVEAALAGYVPNPVPTQVKAEHYGIEVDGRTQNVALLTIVTPAGLTTVFLPEEMLSNLVGQFNEILTKIVIAKNSGLVLGNPENLRIAKDVADQTLKYKN